jgi:tRNA threonylcarbamoyladenosine biosynthesis protein TsaE
MLVYLSDETETQRLAEKIALHCPENKRFIIFLKGELGSGKTTFARFFLQYLGHSSTVKSPTYTLIETYPLPRHLIFHLDLYRLQTPREIVELGLYDEFDQNAIWLIEWPERALDILPTPDLSCRFTQEGTCRQIELQSETPQGYQLLEKIQTLRGKKSWK